MISHLHILLGKGGKNPGLEAYDPMSGRLEKILSLPTGQSVYAIDVTPDEGIIAAATKTGDIYWLAAPQAHQENSDLVVRTLSHCAPLLSICFIGPSTIAISDTIGGCLQWELTDDEQPMPFPTGKRTIFSLFQLDNEHLAGLSLSGELIIWDLPEKTIVQILKGPAPVRNLCGLVKPVYWPAMDRWVWSGKEGVIVFYSWPQNTVRTMEAHSGDVNVLMVRDNELLTIGRTDGRLNRWRAEDDLLAESSEAPDGIISAALWGGQESKMVLINDAGKAGLYTWSGTELKLVKWLAGQDYRLAFGPDIEKVKLALQHQRTLHVRDLATQATERIEQHAWDELEGLYQQLTTLGFRHVALVLRGQEARNKNDLTAELQAYHELAQTIPHGKAGSERSLSHYAELLEAVWQPQRAHAIYEKLLEKDPDNRRYADSACRLSNCASIIHSDEYVIESDIPLSALAKSATIVNGRFTGRYLVKNTTPVHCNAVISAQEIIEKYEQITQSKSQMPQAKCMDLWWLSKDRTEKAITVIFNRKNPGPFSHLEFGIRFVDAGLQTVLMRVILFNANDKPGNVPVEQHNQTALEQLLRIEEGSLSDDGWLQMVHREVNYAIRQLITRRLAESNR